MDNNIKDRSRERMEVRIHAQETIEGVFLMVEKLKPSAWLPTGKESGVSDDEMKGQWRDYVQQAGDVTKKLWKPCNLLIDDLVSFLEGCFAEPERTSESK